MNSFSGFFEFNQNSYDNANCMYYSRPHYDYFNQGQANMDYVYMNETQRMPMEDNLMSGNYYNFLNSPQMGNSKRLAAYLTDSYVTKYNLNQIKMSNEAAHLRHNKSENFYFKKSFENIVSNKAHFRKSFDIDSSCDSSYEFDSYRHNKSNGILLSAFFCCFFTYIQFYI